MNSSRSYPLSLALLLSAASGCGDGKEEHPLPPLFHERSSPAHDGAPEVTRFRINPDVSAVAVRAAADHGERALEFTVADGEVVARLDSDRVILDEVRLELADLFVSKEAFPPSGLALSGLTAELRRPVVLDVDVEVDGSAATAVGTLDVRFQWALQLEQGSAQLAPIGVRASADVRVERGDDNTLRVTVTGSKDGSFWQWSPNGLVLSDLEFDLFGGQPE